jgi:hypothetical protein
MGGSGQAAVSGLPTTSIQIVQEVILSRRRSI